jgi:hypothetical protein
MLHQIRPGLPVRRALQLINDSKEKGVGTTIPSWKTFMGEEREGKGRSAT